MKSLPRGVLVGTIDLVETRACEPDDAALACVRPVDVIDRIGWRLENPHRLPEPLPVRFLPYGVWFYPFRRKHGGGN